MTLLALNNWALIKPFSHIAVNIHVAKIVNHTTNEVKALDKMRNSPGAYAFYEKKKTNKKTGIASLSLFSMDQSTPQVIQTRSYTFTNYLLGEKTVKRLERGMYFSFFSPTDSFDAWLTYLFCLLFSVATNEYSEPHMLRKTHTTFAYQSHWLRLWSFLPVVKLSNGFVCLCWGFRTQSTH